MNTTKLVDMVRHLPEIFRFGLIVLWGVAAFLLLMPSASAKGHGNHDLVVIKPADLPPAARIPGEDMYLYEGNGKSFLYIEQGEGKNLLVLNVTDPAKITVAAEARLAVDGPYDFIGSLQSDSVLIHFRKKNDQESGWASLRLNKPASPKLMTWTQGSGEIVDTLSGHSISVGNSRSWMHGAQYSRPYQVVELGENEAYCLATIPGVKKTLTDISESRRFYLAGDGLWIVHDMSAERKYQEEMAISGN